MKSRLDKYGARATLSTAQGELTYYKLAALAGRTGVPLERMPVTLKILLENLIRQQDRGVALSRGDVDRSGRQAWPTTLLVPARHACDVGDPSVGIHHRDVLIRLSKLTGPSRGQTGL